MLFADMYKLPRSYKSKFLVHEHNHQTQASDQQQEFQMLSIIQHD